MKQILSVVLLLAVSVFAEAQGIYTSITKMDKFDDVVSKRVVKTLITKTDSTIVIETKGLKPVTYFYSEILAEHTGSREKPANLVDDVYGFESQYLVFTNDKRQLLAARWVELDMDTKLEELNSDNAASDSEKLEKVASLLKLIEKYISDCPIITFRTISLYQSEYSFQYDTDMVWIRHKDGSRTIYKK